MVSAGPFHSGLGGGGSWIVSSADDALPFAALQHYVGKSEASMVCGHRNSMAADPRLRISSAIIVIISFAGYGCVMDAIARHTVRAQALTDEAFAPYGDIIKPRMSGEQFDRTYSYDPSKERTHVKLVMTSRFLHSWRSYHQAACRHMARRPTLQASRMFIPEPGKRGHKHTGFSGYSFIAGVPNRRLIF